MKEWRKSSHSDSGAGNCVEVHHTLGLLRDSKNTGGPALRADLTMFLVDIKDGRFDH